MNEASHGDDYISSFVCLQVCERVSARRKEHMLEASQMEMRALGATLVEDGLWWTESVLPRDVIGTTTCVRA